MTVRRYSPADAAAVVDLWRSVFGYEAGHNRPERALACKLAVDDLLFVAEVDGQIVGTTMAGYDGHRGWIYSVAVAPRLRGRGLGAELVEQAVDTLRELGCLKVNLQVREDNPAVVGFYQRLGFMTEARISMGRVLA